MGDVQLHELTELGFTVCYDGEPLGDKEPESAWGISHEMDNEQFTLYLDCAFVVRLSRKNPDTESIIIHCATKHDLETIIDFIQPV